MASAMIIGNIGHTLNICTILFYGTIVLLLGEKLQEENKILDRRWLEEGFCSPTDQYIGETHLDSGLVLSIISFLFISILYTRTRSKSSSIMVQIRAEEETTEDENEDEDEKEVENGDTRIITSTSKAREIEKVDSYVRYAMLGVIAHSAGHFIIYEAMRAGVYPAADIRGIDDLKSDSYSMMFRKIGPGFCFFWTPLIKSYMQNTGWPAILVVSTIAIIGSLQIPIKFGFAFAQCFFFLVLSLDQLCFVPRQEKTFAYALYPFVTVLPSALLSMLECTSCSSFSLLKSYGHIIYDIFMGSSYIIYYVICVMYLGRKEEGLEKKNQ